MSLEPAAPVDRLPPGHRHALPDVRRADPAQLEREIRAVSGSPVVAALLEAVDAMLLVLNAQRQIVAWNGRGLRVGGADLLGARPGEALSCANARASGCGTARACETCGALGAILGGAARQRSVEAECLLTVAAGEGGALELNARATPVEIDGGNFTVLSLRDISAEKRRDALEQLFFHDLLNTVAGLRGWAGHLRRPAADHARAGERIDLLSRQLEREIRDHRALVLAERGALVPSWARVRVADLLRELELVFSAHAAARGRRLVVVPGALDRPLWTDAALLLRVLVNMTRNALEATEEGGEVRVWAEPGGPPSRAADPETGSLRFSVRNEGVMPPEVQARIFQRSFSTKAARGRGLGTYGMKLLGERYLSGAVSFLSGEGSGTVFSIELPASPRAIPLPLGGGR